MFDIQSKVFYDKDDTNQKKRFFIIDGNAYIYKAYYAITTNLKTSKEIPINAVYGFFNTIFSLFKQYILNSKNYENNYVCICFDSKKKVFRNELYPEYKANRKKMPEDLVVQIPILKKILKKMNFQFFEADGFEADDIIATIVNDIKTDENNQKYYGNCEIFIVTCDKDLTQLIDRNVKILPFPKDTIDIESFKYKYGFTADKMLDFLTITGDSSDNIPGISGIGEKGAKYLINKYKSLDYILDNIDELENKYKKKFDDNLETIKISRKLLQLTKDIKIDLDINLLNFVKLFMDNNLKEVINAFKEIESFSLIKKFEEIWEKVKYDIDINSDKDKEKDQELEIDLFGKDKVEKLKFNLKMADSTNILEELYLIDVIDDIKFEKIVISFLNDMKTIILYDPINPQKLYKLNPEDVYFYKHKIIDIFKNFCNPNLGLNNITIYTDNAKYFYKFFKELELRSSKIENINVNCFDVLLAGYILDSSIQNVEKLFQKFDKEIMKISATNFSNYIQKIYFLSQILEAKLKKEGLLDAYNNIELKFCEVLADIENRGLLLDVNYLIGFRNNMNSVLNKIATEVIDEVGINFNLNSPKQVSNILFNKMNLKMSSVFQRQNKNLSTSEEVLQDLMENNNNNLPEKLLQYRETLKLLNTYINPLLEMVDLDSKIKTNFNFTSTSTGRLSSTKPNLQNIPIHSQNGNDLRKAFIPKTNFSLVSFDYSQIDLAVMAHFSQDPNMCEIFLKGEDIHSWTAAKIFKKSEKDEIKKCERYIAKRINFGIIYGMSSFGLSRDLKITLKEAKDFIDLYFKAYPRVKKYIKDTISSAKKNGFVKTILGRKRFIDEINSKSIKIKKFGERIAVNTIIQGSSSDIIKMAMNNIFDLYKYDDDIKMLLQIHDEVLFEINDKKLGKNIPIIKKSMENVIKLKIPLRVNVKKGKNWRDMKNL
ncbi:MAG: DNA polymerase I [Elusimicrobiota bacterium]|jgi:DNA polymerase-1|nr:DNA polymerase I [Elusimicrobiota bacterium]